MTADGNAAAEKIWGHPAGEQVLRALTPADMRALEGFLDAQRARGSVSPPAPSGLPAIGFERVMYRRTSDGHLHADVDRHDFYPLSESAMQDFIESFIGFKG